MLYNNTYNTNILITQLKYIIKYKIKFINYYII